jgi:hypothetical protein
MTTQADPKNPAPVPTPAAAPGHAPGHAPQHAPQHAPRTLAHVLPRRPIPRSRPYLRLLLLIPSLAIFGFGLYTYQNVEPGGTVDAIKLTTKPGPVGQASEALRLVTGTYDLYLKIKTTDRFMKTDTFKDMAIGNGLVWRLPRQFKLQDVKEVDVWDEHTFRSDKNLDHIGLGGQWAAEGQMFRIELQGKANEPPKWALPTLAVGATLSGLVILRFIWDQVV